jgi:hypothetical protein
MFELIKLEFILYFYRIYLNHYNFLKFELFQFDSNKWIERKEKVHCALGPVSSLVSAFYAD